MANPIITTSIANPDPLANPTNLQGVVNVLNPLITSVMTGTFVPYVISSTTPAVSDQDKVWAKIDGAGRPLELRMFYNGNWRRFYTGKNSEMTYFNGNPTTYFDGTGLGLMGLDWDGWALCNGQNGTPNLSNQFIVGAQMDNANSISGYNSGGNYWQSGVSGGASAAPPTANGAASYAIINNNLPYMPVFVSGHRYSQGAGNTPKSTLVDGDYAASPLNTDPNPIAQFGANPSGTPPVQQIPIPTLPPYYAMAIVQFIGYA